MPGYTPAQLLDLTTATLPKLNRLSWTDLTTDIQEMHAMPNILKQEKVQYDSGKEITFNEIGRASCRERV